MKRLRYNTDPLRLALLVSLGLGGCSADALESEGRGHGPGAAGSPDGEKQEPTTGGNGGASSVKGSTGGGTTVGPHLPTGVGGGMTTVPPSLGECEGAVPFLPYAVESGLVKCANGLVHRSAVVACPDLSKDDLGEIDAGVPQADLAATPP
ncbi:MAG: hypothetical protein RJA70_2649 [Pseudomonadota bacterium]|jgi:hypothetical protein